MRRSARAKEDDGDVRFEGEKANVIDDETAMKRGDSGDSSAEEIWGEVPRFVRPARTRE